MESTLSPRQGAGKHTSPWPFVFVLLVLTGSVRAQTISRPIDEVVVRGSQIPALIGVPIDRIHLYRFNGSVFEPIPFQIDEIKTWTLTDNISGCTETEIPADAKVCESNYAFDFSTGNPGGDTTAEFDANDEIVFMARDAGQVAGNCNWLGGDVDPDTRYVVELADERLDAGGVNIIRDGTGWVYIFKWNQSHQPEYGDKHYVQWEAKGSNPDLDRNETCRGMDPQEARRLLACGWARGNPSSITGQSAEPTLDLRFIGNWTLSRLRFRSAANTSEPFSDLLDRAKFRIGGQEINETEQEWDTAGCPRFVGLKKYISATRAAPIRVIRMSQGTMSGATTTRTDWYYGTHLKTRIRLRVHLGAGPVLRIHPDFLSDATPLNLWTETWPADAVPPATPADVVDGLGTAQGHNPPGSYSSGPTHFNWNEFDSTSRGRVLLVSRETRPLWFNGPPSYYYVDSSGANDPQEYENGVYGNAGVQWPGGTLDMQDKICSLTDPDDPALKWREAELYYIALQDGRAATQYVDWLRRPISGYDRNESCVGQPPSPPGNPCGPTLSNSNPQTGYSLSVTPANSCPGSVSGYDLFRATGAGTFQFLARIGTGQSWIDATVRPNSTYRYRVFAFNSAGAHGPSSDEMSVTVADATLPLPPTGLNATPLSHGARVDWVDSSSFDTVSYDVFASEVSGGPYLKLNSQPIAVPLRSFTATMLDPSRTYYIVMKTNDAAGNSSVYSSQVNVTPGP